MNGRVFAVNRSPVLAWNVEPQLQVPYPDMPAAAAAAISPIVPAASDPYGRCWQNQVDAGTSFPYFGTLYSNSLPPPAYRLQPGCMASLGQFWPPTPPPDGCGRFDGSNLYFAPPVTPVLRHGENMSQNLRNSFQGLGHYSHLVETPKESPSNSRAFKRETPISPSVSAPSISMGPAIATKLDNLNTYCVADTKLKPQDSISRHKQEAHHPVTSSGHEPCSCSPDIRISSSSHPSSEKSCFSPSYSLKNTLFHNSSSQDVTPHKPKAHTVGHESNCNASPLKNVYFSHFESENVNPVPNKIYGSKNCEGLFSYEHKSNVVESMENKQLKHSHHSASNNFLVHSAYSPTKKYDFLGTQELCNVSPSYSTARGVRPGDRLVLVSEQCRQSNFYRVKPEKNSHSDCKFQKSSLKRSSSVIHVPNYRSSKDVFNIPTSLVHPKMEPNDKYFLPNCSTTAKSCMAGNAYANAAPLLVSKDFASDPRTSASYHNMIFQNSCSLGKPWQFNGLPIMNHPDNYFKSPEAAKPPIRGMTPTNPAMHEGLISVAQTAPHDMDIMRSSGKFLEHTGPIETSKRVIAEVARSEDTDDEVQIIAVQRKRNSSSSKHSARRSSESRSSFSHPVGSVQPLCIKNEKNQQSNIGSTEFSTSNSQNRKSVLHMGNPVSSILEQHVHNSITDSVQSKACDLSTCNVRVTSPLGKENCETNVISTHESQKLTENCEKKPDCNTLDLKPCITVGNLNSKSLSKKQATSEDKCTTLKSDPEETSSLIQTDDKNNDSCKGTDTVQEDILQLVPSPEIFESKPCVNSLKIQLTESVPACDFNENHGLNLLLDTIEKVTSFETLKKTEKDVVRDILDSKSVIKTSSNLKESTDKIVQSYSAELSFCGFQSTNARGLDLLSAIAGQRFVTEFNSLKSELEVSSHIKSNYPEVKEEMKVLECNDATFKISCDSTLNSCPSSVFEMRDRLVELQKKYKQKQKELSRLKPKKMLANSYLKGRRRKSFKDEFLRSPDIPNDISTCSNPETSISTSSLVEDINFSAVGLPPNESTTETSNVTLKSTTETKGSLKEPKTLKRKLRDSSLKSNSKISSNEQPPDICGPRTRRSFKITCKSSLRKTQSKSADESSETVDKPKKITRNHVNKSLLNSTLKQENEQFPEISDGALNCKVEPLSKDSAKASDILSDNAQSNDKSCKVYALRKSSQGNKRIKTEVSSSTTSNSVSMQSSKTISSKRKSDNPKKYMPSKQSKLSETIVAKHLRNRILFDTSGSVSDDDNQKDGGVPEELYDALMKCHLGEESKACSEDLNPPSHAISQSSEIQFGYPEPSKLKPEQLVEKHRLLALEDGLFYAGCIKEIQGHDRYGITLDGQRGNRLHSFTREELLNQTITESKPSTSELPEGTRVCAYWSQQYRCLYPGVVGKAPCPSADWSEPRVFVLFDDGDSGQIPFKNVRLIPSDIFLSEEDHNQHQSETSSMESTDGLKSKNCNRGGKSRRLRTSRKHSKPKRQDSSNGNECKESSCTSINDSSCDDSCFNDSSVSPSQSSENPNCIENSSQCSLQTLTNSTDAKSARRLRKRSKRKTSCRIKLKEIDPLDAEKLEKGRRHKKYKDKHRHHHHHHHHHRHHHHHHHHSKKHKHRRRNGSNSKNLTSQDLDVKEVIPCSSAVSKHSKNSSDNSCIDHIGHSSADNLPQDE